MRFLFATDNRECELHEWVRNCGLYSRIFKLSDRTSFISRYDNAVVSKNGAIRPDDMSKVWGVLHKRECYHAIEKDIGGVCGNGVNESGVEHAWLRRRRI